MRTTAKEPAWIALPPAHPRIKRSSLRMTRHHAEVPRLVDVLAT